MTKNFLYILLFIPFLVFSQKQKLQDFWVLNKVTYEDDRWIEVNHPMFSNKTLYNIKPNAIYINEQFFKAKLTDKQIILAYRKLNYHFQDNYLVIKEEGDDKLMYFLNRKDFIERYPEFTDQTKIYNEQEVIVQNDLTDVHFKNQDNFHEYLSQNIASYEKVGSKNAHFKATFVLTANNEITDIEIQKSILKSFDRDFVKALNKSKPYWSNNTGKNVLIEEEFMFQKMGAGYETENEREFANIKLIADQFYHKNSFVNAINEYIRLKDYDISQGRFGHWQKEALRRLGISYLAVGDINSACTTFKKIGDKSDFSIRNYLIHFCE